MSPNWEATNPYSVHATGQTQLYHLHQTGILCTKSRVPSESYGNWESPGLYKQ
jgi:hypothetical protein